MTHDPVQILRERFLQAMAGAFGDALPPGADPMIQASKNVQFGDFQANAAMSLAKPLGMKPRDVAERILERLDLGGVAEPVTRDSIAGPGFINIRLSKPALNDLLARFDTLALGIEPPAESERQTVVVDLCGVNLAKQMHVGHLRSTVIGDALARIFERQGHRVIRQSHLGDWGLPIAMVVWLVMERERAGLVRLDALTLDDLDKLYREAQRLCTPDKAAAALVKRYDLGPKAAAEIEAINADLEANLAKAKATLVALQSGDEATTAVWRRISDVTVAECVRTCERLHANVRPEHAAGESSYRNELAGVVEDLVRRGVAVESEGALVVPLEDVGIKEPLLVRKSDGGFLYATTDLAAIRRRVQVLGGDRVVYAVDSRQSLHFRQVFAGAKKAGYTRRRTASGAEVEAKLEHAAFGTILGEDGRPFKTRSGENVKMNDLLDEAIERARRAVTEKNPSLAPELREKVAEAVGIGAIKYADLSSERIKDYTFSFDRMLAFEGDTGPYLQYAHVRIRSIFRKAREEIGFDEAALDASAPSFRVDAPEEKTLALAVLRFPSALASSAAALEPHRLCNYLYELAGAFSSFFQACPVIRAEDEATRLSRLRLCRVTGRVLAAGLETLGLIPLEQM